MTPGPDTKAIVSYLPDADWLPDWMRVEQLVEMFHEFYADFDPAKANEMLARLELEPKARLKTLSKGSKEKVQLILAMSRQADREGYPEIAEAFKRYAWEEAEHASKFAELLGDCVWDTKTNLEKRMAAESGACADKTREGLYNRYFKK